MTSKAAPMLKQSVPPDNVAPPLFSQIFLGADTKIGDQHIFGWSRHIMWQKSPARTGQTLTFAWADGHNTQSPNWQKLLLLAHNRPSLNTGCFPPDYAAEIRQDISQITLKAGFIDKGQLFPTTAGTPQGGSISPTLMNMTLDGLEERLAARFGRNDNPAIRSKCPSDQPAW